MMGKGACALFLSVKYHRRFPGYLRRRVDGLREDFRVKVLLVLVDVEDDHKAVEEIVRDCALWGFTAVLAWTPAEAARYLETFRAYEKKPASSIKERKDPTQMAQLQTALTTVRSVNKTDVTTISNSIGSVAALCEASAEELRALPGFGERKVRRLWEALHTPFRSIGVDAILRKQVGLPEETRSQQQARESAAFAKSARRPRDRRQAPPAAVVDLVEEAEGGTEGHQGAGGEVGGAPGMVLGAAAAAAAIDVAVADSSDDEDDDEGDFV